jgi:hypothetical protein
MPGYINTKTGESVYIDIGPVPDYYKPIPTFKITTEAKKPLPWKWIIGLILLIAFVYLKRKGKI